MDAKKIVGLIFSVLFIGAFAFVLSWGITNFNKVQEGISGTGLYNEEDLIFHGCHPDLSFHGWALQDMFRVYPRIYPLWIRRHEFPLQLFHRRHPQGQVSE